MRALNKLSISHRTLARSKKEKNEINNNAYVPHPKQILVHKCQSQFVIIPCGRRFGKTTMLANQLVEHIWDLPNTIAWWVSLRQRIVEIGFNMILNQFKPLILTQNKSKLIIYLKNGSRIEFRNTKTPYDLVGENLTGLVVDEAGIVQDQAIEESLLPSFATNPHSRAWFTGTPKGKRGWYYRYYLKGLDVAERNYSSFKFRSLDSPYVDSDFVEGQKKIIPKRTFEQEYNAVFLENVGMAIQNVEKTLDNPDLELLLEPVRGDRYIMGVDIAVYHDYTVAIILNHRGELVNYQRFHQINIVDQVEIICNYAKDWNATLFVDRTGMGEMPTRVLERSRLKVNHYHFTSALKMDLIKNLNLCISQDRLKIPDCEETRIIIDELETYEYDINERTGNFSFNAPSGKYDDCVISIALACYGLADVKQINIDNVRTGQNIHTPKSRIDRSVNNYLSNI